MYTQFYGLREKPFSLSPDPRYLFLADSHREALAHLLYGIEQGEGFIAITGEVGTGKTTLCRTLLQRIEPGTEVAFIFNPQLSPLELLQSICAELGLDSGGVGRRDLTEKLNRFLLAKKAENRRVLLIIDEAQNLPSETLEQIRLLSNLETDTAKLVQIVLIGQPELDVLLESPGLRQLRQRISVRWKLKPMSANETRDYVRHRLRIAAGAPRELFSELALREVHRRARGVPRVVNLLCDRALLAGYASGAKVIGLGIVTQTDREMRGSARSLSRPLERSRFERAAPVLRVALPVAAVLLVALAGAFAWRNLGPGAGPASAPAVAVSETPAPATAPVAAAPANRLAASAPVATVSRARPVAPAPAAALPPGAQAPPLAPPAARAAPPGPSPTRPADVRTAAASAARTAALAPVAAAPAVQPAVPAPVPDSLLAPVPSASTPAEAAAAKEPAASVPTEPAVTAAVEPTAVQPEAGQRMAVQPEAVDRTAVQPGKVAILNTVEDLGSALARSTPGAATSAALEAALARWQAPSANLEEPTLQDALLALRQRGIQSVPVRRGRIATLRFFDRPALLTLRGRDGRERTLLLQGLRREQALIAGLDGAATRPVPLDELEQSWTGAAQVLWRDHERLPRLLQLGERGAPVAWLQHSLGRLGFYNGSATGVYDDPTFDAVQAFQQSRRLRPDGTVGPLTKMALYEALDRYAIPRLGESG